MYTSRYRSISIKIINVTRFLARCNDVVCLLASVFLRQAACSICLSAVSNYYVFSCIRSLSPNFSMGCAIFSSRIGTKRVAVQSVPSVLGVAWTSQGTIIGAVLFSQA